MGISQSFTMASKTQLLWLFTVTLLYVKTVVTADVDCNQRPAFVNPKTCCPVPDILTEELKTKCRTFDLPIAPQPTEDSSAEDRRRRHPHPHLPPCYFSCAFNESGIYVNQKLDTEKLKSHLELVFKDSTELQTVSLEAFSFCADKMAEWRDKMANRPRPTQDTMCPHDGSFLMGCVFRKTMKNCPASIWNDTQECNDAKEYFTKCKPSREGRQSAEQA